MLCLRCVTGEYLSRSDHVGVHDKTSSVQVHFGVTLPCTLTLFTCVKSLFNLRFIIIIIAMPGLLLLEL